MEDVEDLDTRRWAAVRRSKRRAAAVEAAETSATQGRTIYPRGADPGRPAFVEQRERRRFAARLADAQLAALLPEGRARHLVERFPPLLVAAGVQLYSGEGRQEVLAETYRAVMQQAPELVPTAEDLAAAAELGEESVIDLMLAEVDRDVRLLLDEPGTAGEGLVGARQIMDALLMIADDGHAPGTRVRLLSGSAAGHLGTVVGAVWGSIGAPVGYRVRDDRDDRDGGLLGVATADLAVPAGQETLDR